MFTNSGTRQTSLGMNDWFFSMRVGMGETSLQTVRLFITRQHNSCSLGEEFCQMALEGQWLRFFIQCRPTHKAPRPPRPSTIILREWCLPKGRCLSTLSHKPLPGNFLLHFFFFDHWMKYFTSLSWIPEGTILQTGHTENPKGENAFPMMLL